jgi:hypothetical protein
MKPEAMLEELEAAAEKLSVTVSYESLGIAVGNGGLCRVKGRYRVIIDRRSTPRERVATLAEALSRFDNSSLFLTPSVREVVDYYAARKAS